MTCSPSTTCVPTTTAPLGEGRLLRDRVICPRHGAAFDARTGRALTLPAVRGVSAYDVTVDGDDVLVDCEAPS